MENVAVNRTKQSIWNKSGGWEEEFLTSELLSNHQKQVKVLAWLGQTTTVRLASFPWMATMGAERYTLSTGPEAVTNIQTCMSTCVIENAPTHKHNFSKHPVLLITADVHLGPDVCVCISHCIKVTQAWNEIQSSGNVTVHEREDVHAIWALAGMSNDVSCSRTGDVEKQCAAVRSLAVFSRGCHSVNPSRSVDVLDAIVSLAQVGICDLDAVPKV